MSLPSDFNPATLLYLNPELQAFSNIITIEEARDYYLTKGSNAGLLYNLSNLPALFDSKIFIADNKDGLNISDLNRTIKYAMSNDGYTQYDLDVFAQYMPTSYQTIRLVGSNTFAYTDLTYQITESNLNVGDDIKIVVNNVDYAFGEVTDIISNTFTISNFYGPSYSNVGNSDTFMLYGHKIYDFERLGRTNWARNNRSSNPVYGAFSNRYYGLDPDFNVELYQLLYPDTRVMTAEQCVLDYTSRRNNNDLRIGQSDEIVKSIAYVFTDLLNLDVSCNLKCDGNFILEGYWVNGITSNSIRTSDFATDSNLITERASKAYLDQYLYTTTSMNNLIVSGDATFCNDVQLLNTMEVYGVSTFSNNTTTFGNSFLNADILVNGDAFFNHDMMLSNDMVVNHNVTVSNDLFVVNQTSLSNNVIIYGTSTINGEFDLIGNGEIWGHLHVHSDALFGSNLSLSNNIYVLNDADIGRNINVGSNVAVSNDVNIVGNLWVGNDVCLSNELDVIGNTCLWSNLNIGSNVSLSNDLFIGRNALVTSNLTVTENTYIQQQLFVCSNVSLSNDIDVYGTGRFYGNMEVASNISLSNDINVFGNAHLFENLYIANNIQLSNAIDVYGDARLWTSLEIGSNISLSNDINVGHDIFISNDLDVGRNTIVASNLSVFENAFISQSLNVGSNISLSNDLNVFGTAYFNTNVVIGCNVSLSNDAYIFGNTHMFGNVYIASDVALSNDIDIYGDTRIRQSMEVCSNVSISNNLGVDGNAFIKSALFVNGTAEFSNDILINGSSTFVSNVSMCNSLEVDGITTFMSLCYFGDDIIASSNILVSNSVFVDSNVDVVQNVNVGNDASISNNMHVYGNTYVSQDVDIGGNINVGCNLSLSNDLVVQGFTTLSNAMLVQETCTVYGDIYGLSNMGISGPVLFSDKLVVSGGVTLSSTLDVDALISVGTSNTYGTLVLDAKGSIRCDEYLLTSDERVKTDICHMNNDDCYNVIKNAPVISYTLQYDPKQRKRYGFLAHEIEQLDNTLVSNITDYIPNVMKKVTVKNNTISIKDHNLKKGDKIKIFIDGRLETVLIISIAKCSFKIDTYKMDGKKIFVYGTEIKDFKTIDYAQMFAISMGALKKVMAKVDILESQIATLIRA